MCIHGFFRTCAFFRLFRRRFSSRQWRSTTSAILKFEACTGAAVRREKAGPRCRQKKARTRGATREPPPRPTGQVRNCTCTGLRPRPQEKKGRGLQFQQPLVRGPPAGTPEGTIGGWYGWPAPKRGWLDHADEILSLSPVGLRRRTGSRPACFSGAKCPSGTGA